LASNEWSMNVNSRERVLTALKLGKPDRVPWVESSVHNALAEKLLGRGDFEKATVTQRFSAPGLRIAPEVLEVIALDNLTFSIAPPRFAKSRPYQGMEMISDGQIKTEDDLEKIKLPDPQDDALYRPAMEFITRFRNDKVANDKALGVVCRMGISNTYLSMGMGHFCLTLYDNPEFVLRVIDVFNDWCCHVVEKVNELGFDFMIVPEDMAWKSAPLFSPEMIREFFLPRMRRFAERVKIPWIYHSDGNIMLIIEDLLSLGMNGLANIEPGAMDIGQLKKDYGQRVCLMGNIDLHYTLTLGTPEETEAEVRQRIEEVGVGGGYILASSNGLTSYCKPENVMAMNNALLKYGHYSVF
jgi:uroporphyrinogen decarboxylase